MMDRVQEPQCFECIHSTINNFLDWPHIGTVMHFSGIEECRLLECYAV
jgi:hypothetical protein